jgi:hypothetical protein
MQLAIEGVNRHLVARVCLSQNILRPGKGGTPQIRPSHARAGIDQQNQFPGTGTGLIGQHRFFDKRPGESKREQAQDQATQGQQQQVFEATATGQPRRGRFQEHQRAEERAAPGGSANEVKNNGQRDGRGSEQK